MEVLGIEKYESEALNKLLEAFYAIVREKDGKDNERDIFRVLIIAVDRYLIDKEHKNPIVRDGEFKSSNRILGENPDYSSTRQREAAEPVSHDTRFSTHIRKTFLMYVENLEMNNSLKWALFIKVSGQITSNTLWKRGEVFFLRI